MNTSKKIWLGISVAIIALFLWGIPLGVYEASSFVYSGTGALLLFLSLFQFFGQYTSLDEIFEKQDKAKPESLGRSLSPFMVIPGFVFLFVLVFFHSHKKSSALETNGCLTKGVVLNGESTQRTRRMQTTTSYELKVQFIDSLGSTYYFNETVSAAEFNNVYKGALVDVVYWREDANIAKVVFNISELSKYKKIPNESININSLTAILEGTVNEDSINSFLNSINYEWLSSEKGVYENSKLNQVIRYSKKESTIVFVETNHMIGYAMQENGKPDFSFENDLIEKGYKKQASSANNGNSIEIYYTDKYVIQKTIKLENSGNNGLGLNSYNVYLITKVTQE